MSDKPEVVAWLHEDGERVVTATALAAANRDAGASADFKTPLVLQIGYIEERELRFSVEARWMAEKERADTLSARVAELEGEVARLREDAERYRWLRDSAHMTSRIAPLALMVNDKCEPSVDGSGWRSMLVFDALDAAIDAAMRQGKGE